MQLSEFLSRGYIRFPRRIQAGFPLKGGSCGPLIRRRSLAGHEPIAQIGQPLLDAVRIVIRVQVAESKLIFLGKIVHSETQNRCPRIWGMILSIRPSSSV